jgi:hypothetical protein
MEFVIVAAFIVAAGGIAVAVQDDRKERRGE